MQGRQERKLQFRPELTSECHPSCSERRQWGLQALWHSPESVKSISCFPHHCCKTYFREPPKINGVALVIKAGFRALLAVRKDGDVGARAPCSSPRCACLSHHSPLHPACPVMSCITCSVVGMSCVTRLYSIFVL